MAWDTGGAHKRELANRNAKCSILYSKCMLISVVQRFLFSFRDAAPDSIYSTIPPFRSIALMSLSISFVDDFATVTRYYQPSIRSYLDSAVSVEVEDVTNRMDENVDGFKIFCCFGLPSRTEPHSHSI